MWTPVNVDPRQQNIDKTLGIAGLTPMLTAKLDNSTYCNLNICISNLQRSIPNGFDRYILGFWFEVFDEHVFLDVYRNNPSAEFVILTDLNANDLAKFERVKVINLYHWRWFIKPAVDNHEERKYKISSLSNRVTEYRAFVTSKLLGLDDVLVTWNAQFLNDHNVDYIFAAAGQPKRDALIEKINQLRQPIQAETFVNDPGQTLTASHPAYTQSLVNSINETKDVCWHAEFGTLPGPYLTEKTWKPLINGNALLFTGQFNTCATLQNLGFEFDYPWSNDYDSVPGDLERLELVLDTIDHILGMSFDHIQQGIQHSTRHNQNLINSGTVRKTVDRLNQAGLEQLAQYL